MGFMAKFFGGPVFSTETTPEGFPKQVVVDGETFEFRLATDRWVAFRSTTRPEANRLFTPDEMKPFSVGANLVAMAEAGAFPEKKKY